VKCGGILPAKFNIAQGLSGAARSKAFQELWQTAHDQNVFIPLFGLNFIHGISPKLHWGNRGTI